MSGRWLEVNEAVFVRDLVRDFCKVYAALEEQYHRFTGDGTVSYAVLRDLLGEAIRKGIFWRLKDTAHHLFRNASLPDGTAEETVILWQYSSRRLPDGMVSQCAVEAILDWCIGYAFHECVKLKEDAFLQQHYANRYIEMRRGISEADELAASLYPLTDQTKESIYRELKRMLHVLGHVRLLFARYLRTHGHNVHLARLLYTEQALVCRVFGEVWPLLLDALYQGDKTLMCRLAARAFWEGGRAQEGLAVLEAAAREAPLTAEGDALYKAMHQYPLPPEAYNPQT